MTPRSAPAARKRPHCSSPHQSGIPVPAGRRGADTDPESASGPYQCTPRMRCASAIASPEAGWSAPASPRAAAESGNTV
jgi:hypothetical protein